MSDELAATDAGFEAALGRLEQIVREMEDGALPLQRLLALFEEGTRLGRRCQEQLDRAELRVKQVVQDADGGVRLRSFDAEEPAANGIVIDGADPAF